MALSIGLRRTLRITLESMGHTVAEAASSEQAREQVRRTSFDLGSLPYVRPGPPALVFAPTASSLAVASLVPGAVRVCSPSAGSSPSVHTQCLPRA